MMTQYVGFEGAELAVFKDAVRVVPAVVLARDEERSEDVTALLRGFLLDAQRLGVQNEAAWVAFSSATLIWCQQLWTLQAARAGATVRSECEGAIKAAVGWVSSGD